MTQSSASAAGKPLDPGEHQTLRRVATRRLALALFVATATLAAVAAPIAFELSDGERVVNPGNAEDYVVTTSNVAFQVFEGDYYPDFLIYGLRIGDYCPVGNNQTDLYRAGGSWAVGAVSKEDEFHIGQRIFGASREELWELQDFLKTLGSEPSCDDISDYDYPFPSTYFRDEPLSIQESFDVNVDGVALPTLTEQCGYFDGYSDRYNEPYCSWERGMIVLAFADGGAVLAEFSARDQGSVTFEDLKAEVAKSIAALRQ